MNLELIPESARGIASRRAKLAMEELEPTPLFYGDWNQTTFVHYEVDPEILQPFVPFELDLYEGRSYVSLVAFTLDRLCPGMVNCAAGEWLMRPISPCRFLNVRTYVKHGGNTGIYFLVEWLSRLLKVPLGPVTYGLPYRPARLTYQWNEDAGSISNTIARPDGCLAYMGSWNLDTPNESSTPGSLTEFLLERYVAFTKWHGLVRHFRIWHEPWQQRPLEVEVQDDTLVRTTGHWFEQAKCIGGNVSPGVREVWLGRPRFGN